MYGGGPDAPKQKAAESGVTGNDVWAGVIVGTLCTYSFPFCCWPEAAAEEEQKEQEEEKAEAAEDSEEAIQKARKWDDWKDTHPRGYGNRKNMG